MKPRPEPTPASPSRHSEVLAPHNLPFQIRLLVQVFTRRFQAVIEPFDLTPLHWGILSCLWQQNGLPTQDISARLQQLGGTLTVALDNMERRKIVKRVPDPEDRRVSRIWLTAKGSALESKVIPPVARFTGELFSCLSPEETSQLSQLVQRLKTHAESMPMPTDNEAKPKRKTKS